MCLLRCLRQEINENADALNEESVATRVMQSVYDHEDGGFDAIAKNSDQSRV